MAAVCATCEPEEPIKRASSLRLLGAKRSHGEVHQQSSEWTERRTKCDREGAQGVSRKKPSLEVALHPSSRMGAERTISYEVSALRKAAAAAVAEYNGPLGPSLQLTEPDVKNEVPQPEGKPQASSPTQGREPPSRAPSDWELHDKRKESASRALSQHLEAASEAPADSEGVFTQHGCPPHGAKAICGRRPRMEDAYTAVPFLLEVPVPIRKVADVEILPARIAPQLRSTSTSPKAAGSEQPSPFLSSSANSESAASSLDPASAETATATEESYLETLHFFGVFDGHGGAEAALHCAQTLHQRIAEALAATIDPDNEEPATIPGVSSQSNDSELESQNLLTMPSGLPAVLAPVDEEPETSSDHLVEDALNQEHHDLQEEGKIEGLACTSASFESALTSAFNRTDEEFGKADNAALVGTTAVVALVGSRQLYVANCGDSRAVLCRSGQAIPLTDDHKAAREDETARVEAAGGHILYWNGVRVMGVLAVSRAIGDHCLRPFVIAQPEVTILVRRPDDEILLLASDGLWDVLNNQEACTLAKRCLRRARQRGASRQSAARIAATVLTRAAVDRGSRDNVTVLVVDLSIGVMDEGDMSRAQSAAVPEQAIA